MDKTISRRGNLELVPESEWREWKIRKQHGDIEAIAAKGNCSRAIVSTAFDEQLAQPQLRLIINSYYGIVAA